jgi:hypothetical protein
VYPSWPVLIFTSVLALAAARFLFPQLVSVIPGALSFFKQPELQAAGVNSLRRLASQACNTLNKVPQVVQALGVFAGGMLAVQVAAECLASYISMALKHAWSETCDVWGKGWQEEGVDLGKGWQEGWHGFGRQCLRDVWAVGLVGSAALFACENIDREPPGQALRRVASFVLVSYVTWLLVDKAGGTGGTVG